MPPTSSTGTISQYYPTLQPLLADIQDMIPTGRSSNQQQRAALQTIANTSVAENQEFKDLLANSLDDKVNKYVDISHRLDDYNEIYNTNKYLNKELKTSEKKMKELSDTLKNKIFISKQKSMMYEYERNKLKFYRALFLASCFLVITLLVLVGVHLTGQLAEKTLYIVTGGALALYLLGVYIIIYSNSFRSHTDWDKYNWASATAGGANNCQSNNDAWFSWLVAKY
jgi:hypothetical protein